MFFEGTDREHVAFPTREAEALLDIFEKRIPNMKRLIEQQDALIGIQDDQIAVLERSLVLTSSNAADALMIAEKWKEAAQAQAESNFWDDLFESPYFWSVALVVGAAGGAGIYAVIDKLDGSLD